MNAASLLHYNNCAADSGEPCTCEPPLTTVEEVAGLLFACHETEYIDAETGWACGCDEDGLLELLTLEDVRKHQAADMVAVLTPLLTAELRARVGVLEGQLATARERLRELASKQDRIPDTDNGDWGIGWDDGHNAALGEIRSIAAEALGLDGGDPDA